MRKIIFLLIIIVIPVVALDMYSPIAGSMGSAYSSIGTGVESICYNPASVAYDSDFQVYTSIMNKYHIANYYSFLGIVRLSKLEIMKIVPSFYYAYENASDILNKQKINLTIGNALLEKFYLGLAIHYSFLQIGHMANISENISVFDKETGIDLGILWKVFQNYKVGFVLNNIVVFNERFQLISSVKEATFGNSYYIDGVGGISLDIVVESENNFYKKNFDYKFLTPRLGIEKSIPFLNMFIRAGLDGFFTPTFGFGFNYDKVTLDYAYLYRLNGSHSLALTYTF